MPFRDLSARVRDKVLGLTLVAVAFAASIGISLWGKHVSEPEQAVPPAPPTQVGVIGWPGAVDPLQTLASARDLTRRTLLKGIVAIGVKSDGTVDPSSPPGAIRYAFQSPPGKGPQPERVPGVVPRKNLCGRQSVHVGKKGLYAEADQVDVPCGSNPSEFLPEPACTFPQIWQHALRKGIPRDVLARIEYYRSAAGPSWRFELTDGSERFSVYGDCLRELSRHESTGSVP